ncbi:uncharacterized protein LOC121975799 [Zingiber officinale]|uniref:uncharacterized protein LOC121975799 n=1 Tax=Zingiber officinale TaxID=94328 RepID=UPI001C4C7AEA|nr:uncharacterized protein LOC121975799 [Zingiber officinale]
MSGSSALSSALPPTAGAPAAISPPPDSGRSSSTECAKKHIFRAQAAPETHIRVRYRVGWSQNSNTPCANSQRCPRRHAPLCRNSEHGTPWLGNFLGSRRRAFSPRCAYGHVIHWCGYVFPHRRTLNSYIRNSSSSARVTPYASRAASDSRRGILLFGCACMLGKCNHGLCHQLQWLKSLEARRTVTS